jgi:hypothetical protein
MGRGDEFLHFFDLIQFCNWLFYFISSGVKLFRMAFEGTVVDSKKVLLHTVLYSIEK